jgi:hypothetical protein
LRKWQRQGKDEREKARGNNNSDRNATRPVFLRAKSCLPFTPKRGITGLANQIEKRQCLKHKAGMFEE